MEFIFVTDHQTMFCGIFICVLGTNPQKLITHQLISKKIIPSREYSKLTVATPLNLKIKLFLPNLYIDSKVLCTVKQKPVCWFKLHCNPFDWFLYELLEWKDWHLMRVVGRNVIFRNFLTTNEYGFAKENFVCVKFVNFQNN